MSSKPSYAVHQSPRLSKSPFRSPTKSPIRRVLGELTPNPRASPIVNRDNILKTPAATLKKSRPVTPADVLSEKHRLEEEAKTRQSEGRKRSLDESADAVEYNKRRKTDSLTADEAASPWTRRASMAEASLSIVPSGGSTTAEDTPEPELLSAPSGLRPSLEAIAVKGSFSSLIDYDPSNASDKSQRPSSSPPAIHDFEILETSLTSQVELLRLRLRVAMYKVRTNQTDVPLSRLKVVNKRPLLPDDASMKEELQYCSNASAEGDSSVQVEERVEQSKPTTLGLLPAPILRPTAYSSRFITARATNLPSSPPSASVSPRKESLVLEHSLPVTRVSSPVKPGAYMTPMARRILEVESEEDLTSSVVKGRAATGLLELRAG